MRKIRSAALVAAMLGSFTMFGAGVAAAGDSDGKSKDGNGRDADPKDEGDWNATDGECGAGSRASNSS
ncbi:protease, partial [Streptomyces sp. NPDC000229]